MEKASNPSIAAIEGQLSNLVTVCKAGEEIKGLLIRCDGLGNLLGIMENSRTLIP